MNGVSRFSAGQDFVAQAVEDGRYGSASEIVREGLRLVELSVRPSLRLSARRLTLRSSVASFHTADEAREAVRARLNAAGSGEIRRLTYRLRFANQALDDLLSIGKLPEGGIGQRQDCGQLRRATYRSM